MVLCHTNEAKITVSVPSLRRSRSEEERIERFAGPAEDRAGELQHGKDAGIGEIQPFDAEAQIRFEGI